MHTCFTLKHRPLEEHKSNKEFLLWSEPPCWVAQTDQKAPEWRRYICNLWNSVRSPLSLYGRGLVIKPISWQGHEIQSRAFVPGPCLIKNNPQPVTIPIGFFGTSQCKKVTSDTAQLVSSARSGIVAEDGEHQSTSFHTAAFIQCLLPPGCLRHFTVGAWPPMSSSIWALAIILKRPNQAQTCQRWKVNQASPNQSEVNQPSPNY